VKRGSPWLRRAAPGMSMEAVARRDSKFFLLLAVLTFPCAAVLGALWFLTPTNLGKSNTRMETVSARFQPPGPRRTWGTAVLLRADGSSLKVPCSDVVILCAQLEHAPIASLSVWLGPPVLAESPWVIAAEHHGRDVLFDVDQRIRLMAQRGRQATVALIFLGISAVALSLSIWLRTARSDPA
jgi:hypothetical protein